MKIFCGYANDGLRPETAEALSVHAPEAELLDFSGDDYAYWHAIKERWTGTEDLVIIEQDMVITAETIPSFRECTRDWCAFGYTAAPHHGRVTACLGCTRYSASLQRQIDLRNINLNRSVGWPEIDVHMAVTLERRAFKPHDHGDIEHLHEYPPFMAIGLDEPGEFTSNEFVYFMPPYLCGMGNKALLEIPAGPLKEEIDRIVSGKSETNG